MRIGISKGFKFEAAHHLPGYIGKCAAVHGHSYHGHVMVVGDTQDADKCGIVLDFDILKAAINDAIMRYDHQDLNTFFDTPTAEAMVQVMWSNLGAYLFKNYNIDATHVFVRLYETETCCVEFPLA